MSTQAEVKERVSVNLQPPKPWKVIFLNDDETPMEFVISLLMSVFKHTEEHSKELTLEIHNSGSAVVGVYTHEIAEQKAIDATSIARTNGFPLKIQIEIDA